MDHHHNSNHHNRHEEHTPPPPVQVSHVHHSSSHNPSPAPPQVSHGHHGTSHNPAPAPPQVSHGHHGTSHNPTPAPPQVSHGHHGTSHNPTPVPTQHTADPLANKPTVKLYCKAKTNYSLSIREGKVILAPSNPSDPLQHWIKDEKYSTRVKDEEGHPCFALVNKATGQAIKHSTGATHPVQLTPFKDDHLDESILWTFSKDLGDSYNTIRMVNNIRLNVDALNGDKEHGGVKDGTKIVLWEWAKGENQRWKIVPY